MTITVGQKIRSLRIQRGLTQRQLSEGIVTVSMVSQIESGKAHPSHRVLEGLAERLDVQLQDLLIDVTQERESENQKRLADSLIQAGQFEAALAILLDLKGRMLNPLIQIELLHGLGICCTQLSDPRQANVHLADALEHSITARSQHHIGRSYFYLAQLAFHNSDFTLAKWHLERADAALSQPPQESLLLFDTRMLLGQVLLELGEIQQAGQTFEAVRMLCSLASDPQRTAEFYINMALSHHEVGEFVTAATFANQADVLFQLLGRTRRSEEARLIAWIKRWSGESPISSDVVPFHCQLSWVIAKAAEITFDAFMESGQPNKALQLLDYILTHAKDIDTRAAQLLHCLQARACLTLDREKEAAQYLLLARNHASTQTVLPELIQIVGIFAKRLEEKDQKQQALHWFHILCDCLS